MDPTFADHPRERAGVCLGEAASTESIPARDRIVGSFSRAGDDAAKSRFSLVSLIPKRKTLKSRSGFASSG
jgi:hypothetical protein